MPYIIGQVTQSTAGANAPCTNFQAQCLNYPYLDPVITYAPPYFFVSVPKDQYVIQVTSPSGGVASAVASVLSDFGGARLAFTIT
jgi:hypothetical protein